MSADKLEREEELTLEEKYEKLLALLEEAINKDTKRVGVVKAGPDDRGYYRVQLGSESNVYTMVEQPLNPIIMDSEVIVSSNLILEILGEELKPELEELDFERISWDEIRGLDSQVNTIKDTIEGPLNHPEVYEMFNMKPLKGIALFGPPGVGKTKIAKAIASTVLGHDDKPDKESFVYLKGGELLSKWVGEAEGNIKNIFDTCRKYTKNTGKRAIIFIDEAEAIVPTRGSRKSSDVETTIVPTFLAEMDGINEHSPFIILASNHLSQIDPAVLRPGRIDLKIEITRPTMEDCKDILDLYFSKTLLYDSKKDLITAVMAFIEANEEFKSKVSGAELEGLVQRFTASAISRIIRDPKSPKGVTLEDCARVLIK